MTLGNVRKYAELLLKIYELEEKLRKNPPTDPTQYLAAVSEIYALWNDAKGLLASDTLTPADIVAAHAMNQKVWSDPKPKPVPPEPEPEPEPEPGPTPAPPAPTRLYWVGFPFPMPSDDELKARGYVTGDRVEMRVNGSEWRVADMVVGGTAWKLEREIA